MSSATWSKLCTGPDIEVILDVVYNHTAEGGERRPDVELPGTRELRLLHPGRDGGGHYANYAGTGNTLNANQSIVRRMILDSLHYWVETCTSTGSDSIWPRSCRATKTASPLPNPPVLWDIESDPVLAGTKLIAEAWDAAGLYQVGHFIGDSWKEWNGQFRDDVRAFVRGDEDMVPRLCQPAARAAPTCTPTRDAKPSKASTS